MAGAQKSKAPQARKATGKAGGGKPAAAGGGWQQVGGGLMVYRGGREDASQAWLLTFTDLSALMLTFFVLLFSMSSIDDRQWQNVIDAFAPRSPGVQQVTVALPSSDQTLDEVERVPGTDLDYLSAVLKEQVAANEVLSKAEVRHEADRIVVSVPGDLLFGPDATELGEAGKKAVFSLAGVLRNLRNVVEVAGHADPNPPGSRYETNWELSLARAAELSGLLSELGYKGSIVVRGYGHAGFEAGDDASVEAAGENLTEAERWARARRVDIIIHSYAAEAR